MNDLKLALIQSQIRWEDKPFNLEQFGKKIDKISDTDLIVLPEMFNTGFTMDAVGNAETMDSTTVSWMRDIATLKGTAIVGSLIISDAGNYFNRMVFVYPDGSLEHYDKRHLFRMTGEHNSFEMGRERKIVDYRGWRINLNICYDLRFPVWSRNEDDFDVLINVASWPDARIDHWSTLLKARAIENLSYVLGINRVGQDENGFNYSGYTTVYKPGGQKLMQIVGKEKTGYVQLSAEELAAYRDRFKFALDRDQFIISP